MIYEKPSFKNILISAAAAVIFAAIYFYVTMPALNIHSGELYAFALLTLAVFAGVDLLLSIRKVLKDGYNKNEYNFKRKLAVPIVIAVLILLVITVGVIAGAPIFNAERYSSLIEVQPSDFTEDIAEISYDKIPMLDSDSAQRLGDRKLGELSEMVSQFEVADNYVQINYNDRPVRVTYLEYADFVKWFINKGEGLPAYISIDMVSQEVSVVRLSEGMKYSPSEHFGRNIMRHLRFNYPTFIFDTIHFEIDENGAPWFVASVVNKTIGLFGGEDIKGAVLCSAVTGECTYYDIADVPTWVDRVYGANLLINQYDYYGTYHNGFWNAKFGQKDVTVTTDGYNYIALDDDVWMYTGITSVTSDESNIGFILSNQRTKETKYYAIAGAEEYSARSSAEGVVQHLNYRSTFPLLLNVAGEPTYFMALKDDSQLVKMYAMVNVRQYQIVATGSSLAETESNYLKLLTDNKVIEKNHVSENADTVEGVIEDIRSAVLEGTTYYYVKLEGGECYYKLGAVDNELAVILNVGDSIKLRIGSTANTIVSADIAE